MSLIKNIGITADSIIDLRKETIKRHNIGIVPLHLVVGTTGESYLDGEISNEELFELADKKDVGTSAPNPQEYCDKFEKSLKDYEHLIHFNISSKISSSHDNAMIAREHIGADKVTVIDTKSCTIAAGLILLNAIDHMQNAEELDQLINQVKDDIDHTELLFILHTARYAKKGGRFGPSLANALETLNVRPVMKMKDGEFIKAAIKRGSTPKIAPRVFNEVLKNTDEIDFNRILLASSNTNDDEELNRIIELVPNTQKANHIETSTAGQIISNHAGPDTYAIAYTKKKKIN